MDKKITGIKTDNIHERIKLLRTQSGMTLQDVAVAMGKKPSYRVRIHAWENGSSPTYANLELLAKVFNASVEWLISGQDE